MENKKQDYDEIDLLKLFKTLWHKAWAIVLVMVIGGALAFSYSYFLVTPLYEASAMLYVNNSSVSLGNTKVSISSGDLTASQSLIDTYAVILHSRLTLETVIEKENLPYTYEELEEMVSAGAVNNTGVLQITVTDADPIEGTEITNTIVDILPDQIATIVEGSSVQIVDYAVVPVEPASPNITKNTLIGIVIGFLLSVAVIFLQFLVDTTIHGEDYLLENFREIPLLAAVPDLLNEKHSSRYGYGYYAQSDEGKRSGKNSGNREKEASR